LSGSGIRLRLESLLQAALFLAPVWVRATGSDASSAIDSGGGDVNALPPEVLKEPREAEPSPQADEAEFQSREDEPSLQEDEAAAEPAAAQASAEDLVALAAPGEEAAAGEASSPVTDSSFVEGSEPTVVGSEASPSVAAAASPIAQGAAASSGWGSLGVLAGVVGGAAAVGVAAAGGDLGGSGSAATGSAATVGAAGGSAEASGASGCGCVTGS
jgi:hypothetical protein